MKRALWSLVWFVSIVLLIVASPLHPIAPVSAQPKAPPLVLTAPPQAPTLHPVWPLGIQRGTALELTLTGTNLQQPLALLASFPCKATFPNDANNGQDPAQLRVRLEVPVDAPVGVHTVQLATVGGLSNLRTFCVDDLPAIAEVDTHRNKATPQTVPIPCVVSGKIHAETSSFFKINVKAGQRIAVEVLGRRLGSPIDPLILLHDVKTGRELPSLYSDDAPGLQTDARLAHTFTEAGEYLIEVRDTLHRGGADYYYRLRIGEFPIALTAYPVAVRAGATNVSIGFTGVPADLEGVTPVPVSVPAGSPVLAVEVAPKRGQGPSGSPVAVQVSDIDEIVEVEPNNQPSQAQRLTLPVGVTGRFLDKGDVDYFVFAVKKGQKISITAETYEILSPAEVYLVLKNDKGAEVAKSNPQNAPRIDYTAAADGDLTLVVEHQNFAHGPYEVYHLTVREATPDFEVIASLDRLTLSPGGSAIVPIQAINRRDYTGPIELSVVGHPKLQGRLTIAPGQAPQPNLPLAFLSVHAAADLPAGAYTFQIQAVGKVQGQDLGRYATVTDAVKQAFGGLTFVPRRLTHQFAVAVTPPGAFALKLAVEPNAVVRGLPAQLKVTATRAAGFAEEIALTPLALPPNVTAAAKPIPKGANESVIPLTVAANAPLGTFPILVRGAAKIAGKEVAFYSSLTDLPIVLPLELKVEGMPLTLAPGAKAKVKVIAVRQGGYTGPIEVEFKNLPANVTAAKAPIPGSQTTVEVEIVAAANAALGEKNDVQVIATATGVANQQVTLANLKVVVTK